MILGSYIPSTIEQRNEMLRCVGVESMAALFEAVPAAMQVQALDLPGGKSELEVLQALSEMADKNRVFQAVFRGAGAYNHYIPAMVGTVLAKEEFLTSYTPYQAEISQGILQSIFEYQTMICELTGMQVSNASIYDGASAAAEAVAMCVDRKRKKAVVSGALDPMVIETIKTYCFGSGNECVVVPCKDGATDVAALAGALDENTACVIAAQPGYYGIVEDAAVLGEMAHAAGAKFVLYVNPIAMALLPSAGECGADVAVGEGQPLGLPLAFGGPYLGFMTATDAMMRKLPGRIVGQTTDLEGRRGYVLTLQAREQHIRREKAASNVCSNQALCALAAGVYMATMGPVGMKQAANLCVSKAHYAAQRLCAIAGVKRVHSGEFFHEFVTTCPVDVDQLMAVLAQNDMLGGLPLPDGNILWCVTEMNSKAQIDALCRVVEGVVCA
jgi:glycine dehydrogenase subunit 1